MKYKDFDIRKSLHVNLLKETHCSLKICAFRHQLSMQEIFEDLARQIVENEPHMVKLLEDLQRRKREKIVRSPTKTDAESIFKVIESENPLNDMSE